jgi:DNA helicase HerA-like ATPase
MNPDVLAAARAAFAAKDAAVVLGAVEHENETHPEPLVGIPLAMMNRHGLIAGATGTGKTKTLQLLAEQLSRAGVPVFLSDIKGDLSGIAEPGQPGDRISARSAETGYTWAPGGNPVELLSLSGKTGAQLRATVSSFGPMLLSKVLDLNETQTSVLTLVFKYCDDKGLLLLDFSDLRAVLQYLAGDGADELKAYGGMSKATVGVLLREMVELEQQGAEHFFGEPEFDLGALMRTTPDGRGLVSVLELSDVQDRPALSSTFMLWMLATLYGELPEVGDVEKPKLVFFFDEAHLLFTGASKALLSQIEQTVRLIRSKGVGIFFVTQSPKDIPNTVLGQLGHRIQHALRAFTEDDEKALRAAARTFPKTRHYDIEETLTTLGIGEALVTVLSPEGVPTPPFATKMVPPSSRMGPLTAQEIAARLAASDQVRAYAQPIDRESAREQLAARVAPADAPPARTPPPAQDAGPAWAPAPAPAPVPSQTRAPGGFTRSSPPVRGGRAPKDPPTALEQVLNSSMARTVAGAITRGLMGALLGTGRRRR